LSCRMPENNGGAPSAVRQPFRIVGGGIAGRKRQRSRTRGNEVMAVFPVL